MKKIKKLLLSSAAALSFTSYGSALAAEVKTEKHQVESDLKVQLRGYAHVQGGYRQQSNLASDEKNVSANHKSFAIFNESAFFVEASHTVYDTDCGAKIVLVPTSKRKGGASYNGSHIFVETTIGRVEAGSPIDAFSTMMIDAGAISAGSGDWDRYAKFDGGTLTYKGLVPSFATFTEFFLDSKLVTTSEKRSYSNEPGRRINYYTPNYDITPSTKLQAGLSYTPDSSNTGADGPDVQSSGTFTKNIGSEMGSDPKKAKERFEFDNSVKDAFSAGLAVEQNLGDGFDVKLALTGEYGKAASKVKEFRNDTQVATHKMQKLKTYNAGATVSLGNYSVAGSYGSLGKSLTTPAYHKTGAETKYYTGGVAYKQGPVVVSLTYFRSNQYKNTVDVVALGTDYKPASGFVVYGEVAPFVLKGKPEFYPEAPKKKTKGLVVTVGSKLNI